LTHCSTYRRGFLKYKSSHQPLIPRPIVLRQCAATAAHRNFNAHVVRRIYTIIINNNNTRYYVSIGPNRLVTLRVLSLDALTAVPLPPSWWTGPCPSYYIIFIFVLLNIIIMWSRRTADNRKPPIVAVSSVDTRRAWRLLPKSHYACRSRRHGRRTTVMFVLLQVTTRRRVYCARVRVFFKYYNL